MKHQNANKPRRRGFLLLSACALFLFSVISIGCGQAVAPEPAVPATSNSKTKAHVELGTKKQNVNWGNQCGNGCPSGHTCQGTQCVPCNGRVCGSLCIPSSNSTRFNCGGCGVTCAEDEQCSNDVCTPCQGPGRQRTCGSQCVDTHTDPNHCGFCGRSCGAKEQCVLGSCIEGDWMEMCIKAKDNNSAGTRNPEINLRFHNPNGNKMWECKLNGINADQKKCCIAPNPTDSKYSSEYHVMYVENDHWDALNVVKAWKKRKGGNWKIRDNAFGFRLEAHVSYSGCSELKWKMSGSGAGPKCAY